LKKILPKYILYTFFLKLFKFLSDPFDFDDPTETILNKYPWTMSKNTVSIRERLYKLKFHKEQYNDSQLSTDLRNPSSKNNHRLVSYNLNRKKEKNSIFLLLKVFNVITIAANNNHHGYTIKRRSYIKWFL
jgi:hypothetical protein